MQILIPPTLQSYSDRSRIGGTTWSSRRTVWAQGHSPRRRRRRQPRAGGRRGDRPHQADLAESDRDHPGETRSHARALTFAIVLVLAPCGARAADLVVWWQKGAYPQEDEALTEIVTAFERKQASRSRSASTRSWGCRSGSRRRSRRGAHPTSPSVWFPAMSAVGARRSPCGPHGRHRRLLQPVRSGHPRPRRRPRRQDGPEGAVRPPDRSLDQPSARLEGSPGRAGFTFDDIPREWDAFWSFWCDRVQPACAGPRAATMSGASASCRSTPPRRWASSSVRGRVRRRLRDPRRQARHR